MGIYTELLRLPTIMDIEDEIRVINVLMSMTMGEIQGNLDDFRTLVNNLDISHIDSGYMEVTQTNKDIFLHFAEWLANLKTRSQIEGLPNPDDFRVIAGT
jgi:hypothetical protein